MFLSYSLKRSIVLFVAALLLCGALRLLFAQTDFLHAFSSLFCGVLTLLWTITVQKRITDKTLRSIMLWVAVSLLLHLTLQILRYDLLQGNPTAQRYLWYAMYIPTTAQPLLCFFLAVCIRRPKGKAIPTPYYLYIAVCILLVVCFFTNDLHFWAKSFPQGVWGEDGQEKNGWLFYLINIFTCALYTLAFGILQKKNHRYVERRIRWLTFIPFLVGLTYMLLYPLDIGPRFFHTRIWLTGEMLCFCIITTLEVCIQSGMIPANKGYEKLFSAALIPAVILDSQGNTVYQTAVAKYPFPENEEIKIMTHPISGGSIEWTMDMGRVTNLNQQLEEAAQQIEARNAYIAAENRIKQERTELQTRNRLYFNISCIVQPQLKQIDTLLNHPEGCGEKQLSEIAVLKAYVKRRSNMELLAAAGMLSVVELVSSITESLEYMRLAGVNTAVSSVGTGFYPAEMVIAAYEHIEAVVEESLDTLSDLVVTIRADKQRLVVRMMLKADDFTCSINSPLRDGADFSRQVAITKNRQDMIIVLTFTEGGEHE